MDKLKLKVKQLIEDLERETIHSNRHMNDEEYGRYNALLEVLELIDEED